MSFVWAFFNEKYLIAPVDFIVALRRTKGRGRRTLRSPPSPSSGLHLIHPGDPLRRGILAAAVDRDLGIRYPVLSLLANSEYCLAICVRLCIVRVSVGVLGFSRTFFIIGGVGRSFLRLHRVLLWSIVGITADREWVVNMADEGEGKPVNVVPSPIWYGLLPLYRKLYPAIPPRRRRMAPSSRSRTIFSGNGRSKIGAQSDLHKLYPVPSPS